MSNYPSRYGPTAVVAGAARGLGASIAARIAAKGIGLVLVDRAETDLQSTATKLRASYGVDVRAIVLDLSEATATQRILEATEDLDVGLLVYNAALAFAGPLWAKDLDYYHCLLGTNIVAPFDLIYRFAPRLMRRGRGGIVMVSSESGQTPQPYLTVYASSKAWNTSFSTALWEELRPYGVEVLNAIVGSVDTPGLRELMPGSALSSMKLADPWDVAGQIVNSVDRGPTRIFGFTNRAMIRCFRLLGLNSAFKVMARMMIATVYHGHAPAQPTDVTESHDTTASETTHGGSHNEY